MKKINKNNNFEIIYHQKLGFFSKSFSDKKSLGKREVKVRPKYVGICGTDICYMKSRSEELRLGHEWIGEVEKVGSDVRKFQKGDTVTGSGRITCGKCVECKAKRTNLCKKPIIFSHDVGALRSSFLSPENEIQKIKVPFHKSLVLLEVLAVGEQAYEHVKSSLQNLKAREVLVFGAGPIGLSIALVLKSYGIKPVIIEKVSHRVQIAKSFGFETYQMNEAFLNRELQLKFSVLIDATNDYSGDKGAFRLIPMFSQKKFMALVVGSYLQELTVPTQYNDREAQLNWMRGVSNHTMEKTVKKWSGKLRKIEKNLISHTFKLRDIDKAFDMAMDKSKSIKVVIEI